MRVLFITDTHLTAKNPSSRTDVYETTSIKKFLELKKIIKEQNIDAVIHGGDLNHSAKVSLRYAGIIAKIMKSWGVDIYITPGNHDIYGYSMSTIDQTMLGFFEKSNVISLLDRDNPLQFDIDGLTLAIEGQEYYGGIDRGNIADYRIENSNADFKVLVTHSMLLPRPFFEGVPHTLIKDVNTEADIVLAGHYHDGFEEQTIGNTTFINPGALIRVESSRRDMPKAVILEFNNVNGTLECKHDYIYLETAKPREEVFDLESKEEKKQKLQIVEEFKDSIVDLTSLKNAETVAEMVSAIANEKEIAESVSKIALDFLTKAEIEDDDQTGVINGFIQKNYNLSVKEVKIRNFQTHENSVIDFKDGLNIIVGESGEGKTSVLRAMQWCLFNTPKGSDFIRTGENECSVEILFNDGSSIRRERTRTSSGKYIINDGKEEQVYTGFGNDIPIEVQNIHQMPEVTLAKGIKSRLNISNQLDRPFLLCESPANKAAAIGRLTGVQIMDIALKNCNKEILAVNKEVKRLDKALQSALDELEEYNSLDGLKEYLEIIEEINKEKINAENKYKYLVTAKEMLDSVILQKNNKVELLNSIPDVNDIINVVNNSKEKLANTESLVIARDNLSNIVKSKVKSNNIIKYIDYVLKNAQEMQEAEKILNNIAVYNSYRDERVKIYKAMKGIESKLERYEYVDKISSLVTCTMKQLETINELVNLDCEYSKVLKDSKVLRNNLSMLDSKENEINEAIESVKASLDELIKNENKCPLCGSNMSLEHVLGGN